MTAREIAKKIIACFEKGEIVLGCGNGGSFDLAHHMEEEFICKFLAIRTPLPFLALKAHTSTSNDFGYRYVFSRQIEAYHKSAGLLIAISTSGKSQNVNEAIATASSFDIPVIEFPRKGETTASIQEYQLRLMHKVCKMVEQAFCNQNDQNHKPSSVAH